MGTTKIITRKGEVSGSGRDMKRLHRSHEIGDTEPGVRNEQGFPGTPTLFAWLPVKRKIFFLSTSSFVDGGS